MSRLHKLCWGSPIFAGEHNPGDATETGYNRKPSVRLASPGCYGAGVLVG
jgi:hypothetical protein